MELLDLGQQTRDFNPWRDYNHVTSSFQQEQCPVEGIARGQKSGWTWADYCCCVGLILVVILAAVLILVHRYQHRGETQEERRQRIEREEQHRAQRSLFFELVVLCFPQFICPVASKLLTGKVDLNTDAGKRCDAALALGLLFVYFTVLLCVELRRRTTLTIVKIQNVLVCLIVILGLVCE